MSIAMAEKPQKSDKKLGRPRKFANQVGSEPESPRSGSSVHVYIDPQLGDALEQYQETFPFKPKKTEILERALREFLQRAGHWPPS